MKSEKSTPRNIKISFLQKLIAYTSLLIQRRVDVFSDPEQIVAGLECNKTNRMLQCVIEGITNVIDESNNNEQTIEHIFILYTTKTLRGEKPSPITFGSESDGSGGDAAAGGGGAGGGAGGIGGNELLRPVSGKPGSSSASGGVFAAGRNGGGNRGHRVPLRLNANDVAGLELVLRLLRSKYLSDVARLEAKRDRASLFSCGSAAAKLARVLRLEARKCIDESLKSEDKNKMGEKGENGGGGGGGGDGGGGDDVMTVTARNLESHASIVEPQVPSAPSNRSPEHLRQVTDVCLFVVVCLLLLCCCLFISLIVLTMGCACFLLPVLCVCVVSVSVCLCVVCYLC